MTQNNHDRRRANRVTFTVRAPVSTDSGNGDLFEDSTIVDISELGVCLRLRGEIVPGQIVNVFLNRRSEECRVVWTSPASRKDYLIAGLEFTRSLPGP
jgi:PilZ domain